MQSSESTPIELSYPNLLIRAASLLIDTTVIVFTLFKLFDFSGNEMDVSDILLVVMLFFYFYFIDGKYSPGKYFFKLEVLNKTDGTTPKSLNMLIRAALKIINILGLYCFTIAQTKDDMSLKIAGFTIFGLVALLNILYFSKGKKQLIHDKFSNTIVVKVKHKDNNENN